MGGKYLLDTHTLIWYQGGNPKMSEQLIDKIKSKENVILFSQLSLIEIVIKQKIGKLPDFKTTIDRIYEQALEDGFSFLNIRNQHIASYLTVPFYEQHRDPFDRLLIATAYEEKAGIMTTDKNFLLYPELVKVLW